MEPGSLLGLVSLVSIFLAVLVTVSLLREEKLSEEGSVALDSYPTSPRARIFAFQVRLSVALDPSVY